MSRRRALLCITYTTDISETPNNEIWYTNGSTTTATTPYSTTVFGANIVSNLYDAEKECWVITFDRNVTTIGGYAFYGCSSLTSITIPNSVTGIGRYAFGYCSSLTSITIPDSVTSIGDSAFCCCESLKEFKGKFAADNGRCLIMGNTIIAYAEASGTTYTIPDSVTTIEYQAFYGCRSLTNVTIPDSVTTIGYYAFDECTSLKSVTIGDSVMTIGEWAFAYCDSLKTVYCKPTTPPTGGEDMFVSSALRRKIYVPYQSVEAYKTATYWSGYAADIVGYDFENDAVV